MGRTYIDSLAWFRQLLTVYMEWSVLSNILNTTVFPQPRKNSCNSVLNKMALIEYMVFCRETKAKIRLPVQGTDCLIQYPGEKFKLGPQNHCHLHQHLLTQLSKERPPPHLKEWEASCPKFGWNGTSGHCWAVCPSLHWGGHKKLSLLAAGAPCLRQQK